MTGCSSTLNPPEIEALFPAGSQPESRVVADTSCIPALSALLSFGYTPLILTGTIRQLLLQHYCDPDNILSARLRRYLQQNGAWNNTPNTGLLIESVANWRPEVAGKRPALLIREGDWDFKQVLIGDTIGTEWQSGVEDHLGMWQGSHIIFAIGIDAAETQILAAETAKVLVWFSRTIANQLDLHQFRVVKIGGLSAVEESREHYVSPIHLVYAAEERWSVQQDAPRLKKITFVPDAIFG